MTPKKFKLPDTSLPSIKDIEAQTDNVLSGRIQSESDRVLAGKAAFFAGGTDKLEDLLKVTKD